MGGQPAARPTGCRARADAETAVELSRELGAIDDLIAAWLELGRCSLDGGQLRRAAELADHAEQLVADNPNWQSMQFTVDLLMIRETGLRMTCRTETAVSVCGQAVSCAERGFLVGLLSAVVTLACTRYDKGDLQETAADADRVGSSLGALRRGLDECRARLVASQR